MEFIADESIDKQIVDCLRKNGYTLLYVAEMEPGITDEVILRLANQRKAILLTADKDFGELVFRLNWIHCGIILVRLAGITPDKKAEIVLEAIKKHQDEFLSAFAVISPGIVRIRKK